jgi:hypothetical protein
MPQIGSPQDNILEPIAGGYPATTPAAAGESAFILGQNLVEDENQETGGRDSSDTQPVPKPYRVSVGQPDLPAINTVTGTVVPTPAVDANGDQISESNVIFAPGTTGGPYDVSQQARARATENGINPALVENETVLAAPKTGGPGTGYGAMSGGTPAGVGSDGAGDSLNTQVSFPIINTVGARNNASVNVISRPGDNQTPLFVD